jgi:hypothetical protein
MVLVFSSTIQERPVTLTEAFHYIDETPTNMNSADAFIGFVNDSEEVIQFLRHSDNSWLFDIPLLDSKTKKWNKQLLQLENISTAVVKRIVELFFVDLDLIYKIQTKFRLSDSTHIENGTVYDKISSSFIDWIERHQSDDEFS